MAWTRTTVISLKISNTSALPITIDEAFAYHPAFKVRFHYPFKIFMLDISDGNHIYNYPPSKSLELPLRIDAYDTKYFSVRLPFVSEAVRNNKIENLKITLETPRDDYHFSVNLLSYEQIHSECLAHKI